MKVWGGTGCSLALNSMEGINTEGHFRGVIIREFHGKKDRKVSRQGSKKDWDLIEKRLVAIGRR